MIILANFAGSLTRDLSLSPKHSKVRVDAEEAAVYASQPRHPKKKGRSEVVGYGTLQTKITYIQKCPINCRLFDRHCFQWRTSSEKSKGEKNKFFPISILSKMFIVAIWSFTSIKFCIYIIVTQ